MIYLWVAVMVVGLIGMIICSKKQKTNPAMQPVALGIFLVVIVSAVMLLMETGIFGGNSNIIESEYAFMASRGHAAGAHLAKVAPGKKLVVIVEDSNYEKSPNTKNLIDLLAKAYGAEAAVEALDLPAVSDDNPQPIEERMKAKHFDATLAKHKDAGVVVSLIGIPQDARRMKAFSGKGPVFFLLGTCMGTGKFVADQMKKGTIAGVVVPNPKADYEAKAPSDPAKAFAIRFVLVTKENMDAHKQFFE